ncbi:SCP-like protein, partial [Opisthorchis viverrini]
EVPKDSEFLDEHNFYRQRLREGTDPEGYHVPGLADLIWDRELAAECRRWAETCVYQYAQNINAEENLASTTNVIGDPVQLWYAYRNKTGHYRKMVSPTAVYLGCHMTRCAVLQLVQAGVNQTNAYYTVCRYSTVSFSYRYKRHQNHRANSKPNEMEIEMQNFLQKLCYGINTAFRALNS